MELLLWRHAEAEISEPDASRELTPKGHKQAHKMGKWLDRNLPSSCRILVSPTVRTVQTAEALGRRFKVHADVAPGATPEQILALVNWPHSRDTVVVIGHQPTLGQTAALLLDSAQKDLRIRKANIWWIVQRSRGDVTSNYLKAVVSPDLVMR